jgi:hypothetical protein
MQNRLSGVSPKIIRGSVRVGTPFLFMGVSKNLALPIVSIYLFITLVFFFVGVRWFKYQRTFYFYGAIRTFSGFGVALPLPNCRTAK